MPQTLLTEEQVLAVHSPVLLELYENPGVRKSFTDLERYMQTACAKCRFAVWTVGPLPILQFENPEEAVQHVVDTGFGSDPYLAVFCRTFNASLFKHAIKKCDAQIKDEMKRKNKNSPQAVGGRSGMNPGK